MRRLLPRPSMRRQCSPMVRASLKSGRRGRGNADQKGRLWTTTATNCPALSPQSGTKQAGRGPRFKMLENYTGGGPGPPPDGATAASASDPCNKNTSTWRYTRYASTRTADNRGGSAPITRDAPGHRRSPRHMPRPGWCAKGLSRAARATFRNQGNCRKEDAARHRPRPG